MTIGKAIRRLLFYFGVAFACLTVFTLIFALSIRFGLVVPFRWVALGGYTFAVFWSATKPLKRYWRRPMFWPVVMGLALLHVLAFAATLLYYPQWPLLWFVPVSIVEAGLIVILLGKLFGDTNGTRA